MQVLSWVAIYFILWWVCLLMVLPMGVRSQTEAGDVVAGTEPGAPALFRIWRKLVVTTVLAAVLLVLVMAAIHSPWLQRYVSVNR